MHIDKLVEIVNKYNNTCHRTIKVKSVVVKASIYINFKKENSNESPKFIVGHNVRTSSYKNIFAKGFVPEWSYELFVIKKV